MGCISCPNPLTFSLQNERGRVTSLETASICEFNSKKQIRTNFDLRNSSDLLRLVTRTGIGVCFAYRLLNRKGRAPFCQKQPHRVVFLTQKALTGSIPAFMLTKTKSRYYAPAFVFGDPYGNRTHVFAVRGRCLSRLTNGPFHQRRTLYHTQTVLSRDIFKFFAIFPM